MIPCTQSCPQSECHLQAASQSYARQRCFTPALSDPVTFVSLHLGATLRLSKILVKPQIGQCRCLRNVDCHAVPGACVLCYSCQALPKTRCVSCVVNEDLLADSTICICGRCSYRTCIDCKIEFTFAVTMENINNTNKLISFAHFFEILADVEQTLGKKTIGSGSQELFAKSVCYKTLPRRFQDASKTLSRRFEDAFQTCARRSQVKAAGFVNHCIKEYTCLCEFAKN